MSRFWFSYSKNLRQGISQCATVLVLFKNLPQSIFQCATFLFFFLKPSSGHNYFNVLHFWFCLKSPPQGIQCAKFSVLLKKPSSGHPRGMFSFLSLSFFFNKTKYLAHGISSISISISVHAIHFSFHLGMSFLSSLDKVQHEHKCMKAIYPWFSYDNH